MLYLRFFKISTAFCLALFLRQLPFAAAQDISAEAAIPAAESEVTADGIEPLKITVDVKEIRLDVVVLDFFGRPITNLIADDFEVYQDGKLQEVTSAIYMDQTKPASQSSASQKASPYLPKVHAETLKEEDVRRTILFVVDNVSMSFTSWYDARTSINRFLENQMQPGDLVGIMQTGPGNSAYNVFSTDKRQLSARANAISIQGIEDDFSDLLSYPANNTGNEEESEEGISFTGNDLEAVLHRIYSSQLASLTYSVRALKDMPGRKILLFLTARPALYVPRPGIMETITTNFYEVYGRRFERLADEAMRSGVVVHSMDIKGLGPTANSPYDWRNPLAGRTGGIYVEDNNFFLDGIGKDVSRMISGYYLVSYIPPPSTFSPDRRGNEVYHPVKVNVKRRFAGVYTRHGFYGSMESEKENDVSAHPLQKALFSPFLHADINVSMFAGYAKDAKAGYLVRSWINIDPKDLKIVETENGGRRIALKLICLTSDERGVVHDARYEQYVYNIEPESLALIQEHGIRFSMLLPVKKPGVYTVSIGIQDIETEKTGSAWQLVEIPDLSKKDFVLSSIFMITGNEDLAWLNADALKQLSGGLFFPVISDAETGTPALRTYKAGDSLQTLAILYNADGKAIARNEIEMVSILYKDGKEFLRGEPRLITADKVGSQGDVTIMQKLALSADIPPGDYVLQLLVINKEIRRKEDKEKGVFSKILKAYIGNGAVNYNEGGKGIASEALSFRVIDK